MTTMTAFLRDEAGAVTIDWVALTAGVLLLGIAVVYTIFEVGIDPVVGGINDALSGSIQTGSLNIDLDNNTNTAND